MPGTVRMADGIELETYTWDEAEALWPECSALWDVQCGGRDVPLLRHHLDRPILVATCQECLHVSLTNRYSPYHTNECRCVVFEDADSGWRPIDR